MPLLQRKRVLAAKVETTIGTAESLTASEGVFNAYNVIAQANITAEEREGQGAFNRLSSVTGMRTGTISFRTDLSYDGSTVPTWASVLLPMCGWVNATGTFTPRTEAPGSNVKTGTIGVFMDGMLKRIAGAVGDFSIVFPSGRMAYIDWTFTGVWQAPTDTAIIAPTYPTDPTLRAASMTTSWNATTLCFEQITVASNNEIVARECTTSAAGVTNYMIADRRPTITGNPETELVATQDRFGQWIGHTEGALSIAISNAITISASKAQIINIQEGNRNRIVIDEIEWQCNKNGTTNDSELSIVFS